MVVRRQKQPAQPAPLDRFGRSIQHSQFCTLNIGVQQVNPLDSQFSNQAVYTHRPDGSDRAVGFTHEFRGSVMYSDASMQKVGTVSIQFEISFADSEIIWLWLYENIPSARIKRPEPQ